MQSKLAALVISRGGLTTDAVLLHALHAVPQGMATWLCNCQSPMQAVSLRAVSLRHRQATCCKGAATVIMYGCRPVGGEVLQWIHSSALQNTSMAQQHVGHLNYRRHVNAAANKQLTRRAWSRERQNNMYAMLPCQGMRHDNLFSSWSRSSCRNSGTHSV